MLCGVFKLFDRQMRSRAHDNPAFNINIAHKMASNFKKGSNGEGRNLANRDKCNKRHSFAGPVCHYTKQHLSSLGRISDFAKNLDVHLDSSNSENDREQNVLFWPPFWKHFFVKTAGTLQACHDRNTWRWSAFPKFFSTLKLIFRFLFLFFCFTFGLFYFSNYHRQWAAIKPNINKYKPLQSTQDERWRTYFN